MPAELLDDFTATGYPLGPGELGENILTHGLELYALPVGTFLHLGERAVRRTGLRDPR
ncbi:hypothetical protein ACIGFK_04445 [Streptomyces sp. NPDC085524]|uniref:hypothetical protein n=1 Tax=unclassified Streptomyces TaxID=2593676 RepID=UPI0036AF10E3